MLHEAIYNDTKYLCSQSIMDYSLLLGLDEKRHELVVGIVDAIGSYNLFKTIESRGKLALNRGGEVTIVSCSPLVVLMEDTARSVSRALRDGVEAVFHCEFNISRALLKVGVLILGMP